MIEETPRDNILRSIIMIFLVGQTQPLRFFTCVSPEEASELKSMLGQDVVTKLNLFTENKVDEKSGLRFGEDEVMFINMKNVAALTILSASKSSLHISHMPIPSGILPH